MNLVRRLNNPAYGKYISLAFFVFGIQVTVIFFLLFGSAPSSNLRGKHHGDHRSLPTGSLPTGPSQTGAMRMPQSRPASSQSRPASSQSRSASGGRHGYKFQAPTQSLDITQKCDMRPYVIGGFTGSGTRLPMRILQRAGVHMGPDDLISEDGDTLAWIRSMQKKNIHSQIQGVLTQTGSPVYDLAQLASQQLATDINEEFNVFKNFWENELQEAYLSQSSTAADVESLCSKSLNSFSWGWKGPRQMWFLPFIESHFPKFHFIYAVRDVRDLLNSHTSFTEHDKYWVKSFFSGKGEPVPKAHDGSFEHAGVAQMWAEAALDILKWCESPANQAVKRCSIVKPQSLSGDTAALPEFLSSIGLMEKNSQSSSDTALIADLKKNVLGACLGSSSSKSDQHGCDQQSDQYSPNYRIWSKPSFYESDKTTKCAQYRALMQVPFVHEALSRLGFDADYTPAACAQ